ncbi:ABC transporter substrate-binding protein [Mitsuokella sp.]|uniref:ABC transporter substrate-binding protein n=1 Tax=Mitsuokella sp. TaxID=2049034 RepID=UPI002A82F65D|nr:ABC transporter substrate-binding protein [Mitsuokella sp.]MDY4474619.1 ABC transporter substrate-binding protein [Mitsuokella sp.]
MKRFVVLCLALLTLLVAAGCGSQASAPQASSGDKAFAVIHDAMGREVTLTKKPERIVVTSASFLEPLHEVGGDVVGRPDSKTKMPEYAKDKASVGKVYQIDVEKVLACEPDLVIVNKGMNEKLVDTLESNGIQTIVLDMKSYDDVKNEVQVLAQITGEPQKGEQLIHDMDAKIQAIKDKIPQDAHRVSILHTTNQGLSVQLEGSIAGCTARLLGWDNVAAGMTPLEKNPDAAPYSLETLVEQNPEILFITSMGKLEEAKAGMEQTMTENPAWQTVDAVKNGRVYYLPQDLFLLSPGIHYPEAVETMAKCVYPEAFAK